MKSFSSTLIVVLFTIGWTYAIADAHARDADQRGRALRDDAAGARDDRWADRA